MERARRPATTGRNGRMAKADMDTRISKDGGFIAALGRSIEAIYKASTVKN